MEYSKGKAKASALAIAGMATAMVVASPVLADEGGTSFWLPGQISSFAAVQGNPGWSMPITYYHYSGNTNPSKTFQIGAKIASGVNGKADLFMMSPTYVFSNPVAGAQAAVTLTGLYGRSDVGVDVTLTGPGGNALSGHRSDTVSSHGDLYPMGSLKWNQGNNNYMVYAQGSVPVGSYDKNRLANIGSNHWSVDAGAGYTYLNQKTGFELSATAGMTYNFENHATNYRNGNDGHIDWAVSQFLSEQFHIGVVGYVYRQLTGDSGTGARLGEFKSRVSAIGPEVGYFIPVGGQKWYLNLRAYSEHGAENRLDGWSAYMTLAIPL
jgi:hypothetical protein